jgi:DNA-binding MarR family transcriptional regulator
MTSPKQFHATLHEWAEVFMRRSMRAWLSYVRSTGLSMPQYSTLMQLYYRGQCGISDVRAQLDVTPAAASQLVDRLVKDGYLERTEDAHDRRVRQLRLTDKSRALIEAGIQQRNAWTARLVDQLDPGRREAVAAALKHLIDATQALQPEE